MKVSTRAIFYWLFLVGFSCVGQAQVIGLSDGQTRVADLHPQRGSHETAMYFDIPDRKGGRLQIQLRIPFSGAHVALKDPSGRVTVPPNDPRVQFQPRDQVHHPERGDRYQLPELRDPAPGRWGLSVLHPEASGSEIISVTLTLLERFALHLSSSTVHSESGEPILITALPSDYGAPMEVDGIPVTVTRDSDTWASHIMAREDAVSATGIRLSNEPGHYFAVFRPDNPGTYSFTASLQLPGEEVRSNRVTVRVRRPVQSQTGDVP